MKDFDEFIKAFIKAQEDTFKSSVSSMVNAKEYVKKHKHINYCEIIINKDGLIAEAHPSHTEFLRMYAGLSQEELMDLDKDCRDTPLHTLLKHTDCVAVWYNCYADKGSLSNKQREALTTLIEHDIVDFSL